MLNSNEFTKSIQYPGARGRGVKFGEIVEQLFEIHTMLNLELSRQQVAHFRSFNVVAREWQHQIKSMELVFDLTNL